jgi:primase-polymerase (primpol)-like protein
MTELPKPHPPYRIDLGAITGSAALASLTAVPERWVNWRYELRGGNWTKPPYRPNGARADVSKPITWFDFEQCAAAIDNFAGVGFVLDGSDDLIGIDVDDCIAPGGRIDPALADFLERLDTYTEDSPSGTGLRCFLRGVMSRDSLTFRVGPVTGVAFRARRYLTITGDRWDLYQDSIEHRQGIVDWIEEQAVRRGNGRAGATHHQHEAHASTNSGNGSGAPHWFDVLDAECQLAEVGQMLEHLTDPEFGRDYELWLKLSFAVHHATRGQGYELWDR